MIATINKGESYAHKGVYFYEIYINKEFIALFEHRRNDGLSACLLKASLAVKKANKDLPPDRQG